jgi:hypothetical protein
MTADNEKEDQMDYKPSQYLARMVHFSKGEPSMQSTLSIDDESMQAELRDKARSIVTDLAGKNGLHPKPGFECEILLGATANRMERMEDLLNDCRNLLIDLEDAKMSDDIRRVYEAVMGDLDLEVG